MRLSKNQNILTNEYGTLQFVACRRGTDQCTQCILRNELMHYCKNIPCDRNLRKDRKTGYFIRVEYPRFAETFNLPGNEY